MNTEAQRLMADSILAFRIPRYHELPDMGLYLEQVVRYLNSCFTPLGCPEVTNSMVSNYVKMGLIPKPEKKQYSAMHLSYLFFVVLAKNTTSLENIALMIGLQKRSYPLPVAHDYLCGEFENMLRYIFGLADSVPELGTTTSEEKTILRHFISALAHTVHTNFLFDYLRKQE